MINQYNDFAYVYDRLMEDVDYKGWVVYLKEIFKREGIEPKKILELACGTGNITLPLSEEKVEVMAVDISQEMLMVAKDKALTLGKDILFVEQDMTQLELEGKFDVSLCMCDGINYILEEEELVTLFKKLHQHLTEEGIFVFDISSYYKLSEILGENTYGENQGDLCYLWENYFDEETNILEMNLAFFLQEEQLYRKFEEYHQQRAYHITELKSLLLMGGFKSVSVYDGFKFDLPHQESERIFFVCRKD
ncbi:class I SAM-dependent DNA methyltransferase [Alkaliphilus transvaalensis]|uniref:class I SAM-dependent DNA methyltransferase n=1 Tax=Alkaliphilus transvaalensis TaxID=114628 RepID=UPI0012EC595B|nr:class I SAM-dependent methyltransferase [Alkaliphilus transvaalensis]